MTLWILGVLGGWQCSSWVVSLTGTIGGSIVWVPLTWWITRWYERGGRVHFQRIFHHSQEHSDGSTF